MRKIRRALVSVSDKSGLAEFCKVLSEYGVEILSTGGTAKLIRSAGVKVTDVSEHTGSPEILDGRVKTLHPKIHGGILYRRELEDHVAQIEEQGIAPIDMVVCNLYPFENTIAKEGVSLADAIENIDIGGPCMVRASAKNHKDVAVLVSPSQYEIIVKELKQNDGSVTAQTRFELALAAFRHTAHYDAAISTWLSSVGDDNLPPLRWLEMDRTHVLSDNRAESAIYGGPCGVTGGATDSSFVSGDDPGIEDFVSCMTAGRSAQVGGESAVSVIRKGVLESYCAKFCLAESVSHMAQHYNAVSKIVLGFAQPITAEIAELIINSFASVDAIAAPSFSEEATKLISKETTWGKKAKLFEYCPSSCKESEKFVGVESGMIVEKMHCQDNSQLELISSAEPEDTQESDAKLAWDLLSFYKSPCITLVKEGEMEAFSSLEPNFDLLSKSVIWKAGADCRGAIAAISENPEQPSMLSALFSAGVAGIVIPGEVRTEEAMENLSNHHNALLFKAGYEKKNF